MNRIPKRSLVRLINAAWEATTGERTKFFAFVAIFTIAYTIELLTTLAMGYTLSVFAANGFNNETFHKGLMAIGLWLGLKLVYTFCHHYARYLQNTVAYSARMFVLNRIFGSLMDFPLNWHAKNHSGDNLGKLHRSTGAIEACIGTYIWQIIEGLVKVVLATIAIIALDFWVALNVFAMSLVTILIMIFFNRKLTDSYRQNNSFANKINRICIDYLFNIVTVKTLGLERPAKRYLEVQRGEGLRYSQRISKFSELKWGTTSIGYCLVHASSLAIYFYGRQTHNLEFDITAAYVLIGYLDKIFQAIGSFTGYYGGLIEAATAYEDGAAILDEVMALPKPADVNAVDVNWKRLSVNDLSFAYATADRTNLKEMAFDIQRGDKVALVGPSGGGKSTLLKVIGGLLIPDSCNVWTDRQERLSMADIARISLLVPQEPEIFSETFRYNLTMGEDFGESEIAEFITLGRLDGVLGKLPLGQETNLAEKGLNLSVGEKQRVAMVRGLLRARSREIILLDEPTSSLDPKTEKEIFLGLLTHFSDRVIVTACHRLNLVPLFDKIIYIRDGRIEEVGSFQELIDKKGYFAGAWEDYERRVPPGGEDVSFSI